MPPSGRWLAQLVFGSLCQQKHDSEATCEGAKVSCMAMGAQSVNGRSRNEVSLPLYESIILSLCQISSSHEAREEEPFLQWNLDLVSFSSTLQPYILYHKLFRQSPETAQSTFLACLTRLWSLRARCSSAAVQAREFLPSH